MGRKTESDFRIPHILRDSLWGWVLVILAIAAAVYAYNNSNGIKFADIKESLTGIDATWYYVAISFVGTIANMCGSKLGFVFWMVSNALWIRHFYAIGQTPQMVLFTGYLITSLIGFFIWMAKEDDNCNRD